MAISKRSARIPATTPSTFVSLLYHVVALILLVAAFNSLKTPSKLANFIQGQYGSWYQFLTVLGLCSAIASMAVAILKDLLPSVKALDQIKNSLGIVTVPVEGLISVLYWGLRSLNPNLLMPPDPRYRIPLLMDLSLHALPALLLWVDFIFLSPPFSAKSRPVLLSVLLTAGYTGWMEYCAYINGNYPYPFLGDMPSKYKVPFYAVCGAVNVLLFHAANAIHIAIDRYRGKDISRAKAQARGKSK